MARISLKKAFWGIAIMGILTAVILHRQSTRKLHEENAGLRQQLETLQKENQPLSGVLPQPEAPKAPGESPSAELLRLRGEVGMLRRQAAELNASLVKTQNTQPRGVAANPEPQQPETQDYPKTPEAATRSIFNSLVQGDMEKFFTNFGEPGVPKEVYDKLFDTDRVKGYLASVDTVMVGEPTNSFSPGAYFVPYKIRFKDGTEKEMRLHVGQDPRSQKWYLKGGI